MKLKQHIMVGNYILNNLDNKERVSRVAFLIGSIAPDLNCVYPAHRLDTTENRFYRRLRRVALAHCKVVRSFALGIISHYICDYFCYAHSIGSLGIRHKNYETRLYKYYLIHLDELEVKNIEFSKRFLSLWDKEREERRVLGLNEDVVTKNDINEHCKFILNQLKEINQIYVKEASELHLHEEITWCITDITDQLRSDLEYAMCVANHIILMLVSDIGKKVVNNV